MARPVYVLHDEEVRGLGSLPSSVFVDIILSAVHRAGPDGPNGPQQREMRLRVKHALETNGMAYLSEVPEAARAYFLIHTAIMSHRLRNGPEKA